MSSSKALPYISEQSKQKRKRKPRPGDPKINLQETNLLAGDSQRCTKRQDEGPVDPIGYGPHVAVNRATVLKLQGGNDKVFPVAASHMTPPSQERRTSKRRGGPVRGRMEQKTV